MKLQEFSKSRNLKVAQVRELCNVLFGNIPDLLSDDNISALDNALYKAALDSHETTTKALPQSNVESVDKGELVVSESQVQSERVVRVVGESVLRQNLQLYLTNIKKHFLSQQFEIDSLHFQVEQGYYQKLATYQQSSQSESILRINKNSQLLTRQGVEQLKTDNNTPTEDIEMLNDIGELMDFFSIV